MSANIAPVREPENNESKSDDAHFVGLEQERNSCNSCRRNGENRKINFSWSLKIGQVAA